MNTWPRFESYNTDTAQITSKDGFSTSINYGDFVQTLIKSFDDWRIEHLHAAIGVAGEAGELCDAIKRHAVYGKAPDVDNIIEELGDLEFFMEDVRRRYNIDRQRVLQANVAKLEDRYKGLVYSDEAAIARADKIAVHTGADPEFTTDIDEV